MYRAMLSGFPSRFFASSRLLRLICVFGALVGAVHADEDVDQSKARFAPMDVEGLEPRLARALTGYYEKSFGGAEGWKQLESLKFRGQLSTKESDLEFIAYKKKPNLCKIVLIGEGGKRLVSAFDGATLWREGPEGELEFADGEQSNFIRDAVFDSHLFYPQKEGKVIKLLGTKHVGEELCFDILVVLDNGVKIRYAIDANEFVERDQMTTNLASGREEINLLSEHRRVGGLTIVPFKSVLWVDGEIQHTIELDDAMPNKGVMPWMFDR